MPFGDIVSVVAPLINGGELLEITTGAYLFRPGEKAFKLTPVSTNNFSTFPDTPRYYPALSSAKCPRPKCGSHSSVLTTQVTYTQVSSFQVGIPQVS